MSRKFNIKVIKVPTERPSFRQKNFTRMPIMYLELLENKNKIKPDLVNKEYVPKIVAPQVSSGLSSIPEEDKEDVRENYPQRNERLPKSDRSESSDRLQKSDRSDRSDQSDQSDQESPSPSPPHSKEEDDDDLSSRMKELLGEERRHNEREKSHSRSRSGGDDIRIPKLSEIGDGKYVPRKVAEDLDHSIKNIADEEDLKRELLFKFDLLKRSYKNSEIPEHTVHSDYKTMLRSYENTIKRVNVDNNVETYRGYLIAGFYIVEYVFGYYLGFDMENFAQQQVVGMNKYEHLLIELGEKSYVPTGSQWPVEIRLLFVILVQTAIFIVTKMVMKKIGGGIGNIFGAMNGGGGGVPQQRPRMRMQGPDMSLMNN